MPQLVIVTDREAGAPGSEADGPAVPETALAEHPDLTALAFLVARAPTRLDVHLERLERAHEADEGQLHGALIDLFLATGVEEAEMRAQLLDRFGDRLTPEHRAALEAAVGTGFAPPATPAPASRHSVLDPGGRESVPLLTPVGRDEGRTETSPQPVPESPPPQPALGRPATPAAAPHRGPRRLAARVAVAGALACGLVAALVVGTRPDTTDDPTRPDPAPGSAATAPTEADPTPPSTAAVPADAAPVIPETVDPVAHAEAVVRTWAWLLAHPDPDAPDRFLVPGTPAHRSLRRTLGDLVDEGRGVRLVDLDVGPATRQPGPDGTVAVLVPVRWSASEEVDLATGERLGDRPLFVDEVLVEVRYPEASAPDRAVDVQGHPVP